jgi:hypothetical protein
VHTGVPSKIHESFVKGKWLLFMNQSINIKFFI